MKKKWIIGGAAVLAALLLVWSYASRTPQTLPMVTPEKSVVDEVPGDGSGDRSGTSSAPEQSGQPEGTDASQGEAPAQTEPEKSQPAGEQAPAASQAPAEQEPAQPAATVCTISISCATILDHMDQLDGAKTDLVPADGWLLPAMQVEFQAGESVFDVLKRVCRDKKIHMEFSNTPMYNTAYIEGIGNLYEFDCGDGSGWMYSVNGQFPNYGCSQYSLKDGDVVAWVYTCDYGADVGGQFTGDTAEGQG